MTTRDEAIEILKKEIDKSEYISTDVSIEVLEMAIKALQERRTSKWNLTEIHNCYEVYKCEKCGREITVFHRYGCSPTVVQVTEDYPYCHCGAKMEVDE